MATFRHNGNVHLFRDKFIAGMTRRGYAREFAESCFSQIEGFGEYGFPESHAASFALLVYASAWIKCHYPDVFCAAILNSQPMGFYQPAQLVRDAREHGVEVREADVNFSAGIARWSRPRNGRHAVRLGFRQIQGLNKDELRSSSRRAATAMPASSGSPRLRASRASRSSGSPRRTPSARSGSTAAPRCGPRGGSTRSGSRRAQERGRPIERTA